MQNEDLQKDLKRIKREFDLLKNVNFFAGQKRFFIVLKGVKIYN